MHASRQDALYLQAAVYERFRANEVHEIADVEWKEKRDLASRKLKEAEAMEKRYRGEMDKGMMAIWDTVCEIGVAVANGATF